MTTTKMTFAQGLQLFFIEKILTDKYAMGTEARSKRGIDFFAEWSRIVCEGQETNKQAPLTLKVPDDFKGKHQLRFDLERLEDKVSTLIDVAATLDGRESIQKEMNESITSFAPEPYHELLRNGRFTSLFHLLADEDLGSLMQIEYPSLVAEKVARTTGSVKNADIVREAVARFLDKKPVDLTPEDHLGVEELNVSGTELSDVTPLAALTGLQTLLLQGTQVSNLTPLKALTSLQWLSLDNTQVSDLTPLKALTNLRVLWLAGTEVRDVTPLKGLTNLVWLSLDDTKVSDVTPLAALTKLERLFLFHTQVSDVRPLARLTNLDRLTLFGTHVSNDQVKELKEALPKLSTDR